MKVSTLLCWSGLVALALLGAGCGDSKPVIFEGRIQFINEGKVTLTTLEGYPADLRSGPATFEISRSGLSLKNNGMTFAFVAPENVMALATLDVAELSANNIGQPVRLRIQRSKTRLGSQELDGTVDCVAGTYTTTAFFLVGKVMVPTTTTHQIPGTLRAHLREDLIQDEFKVYMTPTGATEPVALFDFKYAPKTSRSVLSQLSGCAKNP